MNKNQERRIRGMMKRMETLHTEMDVFSENLPYPDTMEDCLNALNEAIYAIQGVLGCTTTTKQ